MLRTDTAGEKAADAAFISTPAQDGSATPSPFALREELIDLLRRDLLGPADGPEEEIPTDSRLTQRYLVGSLAPGAAPPVPSPPLSPRKRMPLSRIRKPISCPWPVRTSLMLRPSVNLCWWTACCLPVQAFPVW